jgi:hypothetical protein
MLRPGLLSAAGALLVYGAFWSVRLARADADAAQTDLAIVNRACRTVPQSAAYWLRSAAVTDVEQPESPEIDRSLERAITLNPLSAEARIARAVRLESRGEIAGAEREYLNAAQVSHMYKPAWALANFYARQQRPEEFWMWARKCLEVVEPRRLEPFSYNPGPIFDLAWRILQNASEIRRRLIPQRHFILVDYLEYLGERGLTDEGAEIAVELPSFGDPGDNYYLLNFCDRLINEGKGAPAVAIWNAMAEHALVRGERLDARGGLSLSNADLRRPFERLGFDWRLPVAEGVLQNHFPETGMVRLEFSGDQPEGVLTFFQSVPVVGGAKYRLNFRYRTQDMQHANGLIWQIWDYAGQKATVAECRITPQADLAKAEARFTAPAGASVVRLGLVYQRAPGSTHVLGTITFSDFSLSGVDQ